MDARLAAYVRRLAPPPLAVSHEPAIPRIKFGEQLRSAGVLWRATALLATHAAETGMLILGWACFGSAVLAGHLDAGWVLAWALCIASVLPLRAATQWFEGAITVSLGGLLRERLLDGALAVDADFIRRKGTGELLGQVLEIEQIERLGAAGGVTSGLACLELAAALIVLGFAPAAGLQICVLLASLLVTAVILVHNTRRRQRWTAARFEITRRLVENMSAHRTRAVQQCENGRHQDEDLELADYSQISDSLDRSSAWVNAALSRGYLILALLAYAPSLFDLRLTVARHAIALGGMLLAAAALRELGVGFGNAAAAWIAWRGMRPLFDASQEAVADEPAEAPAPDQGILVARDLIFTHRDRCEPALRGCSLSARRGDLVLLEGPSGSGKSTLAAVLAGLRRPSSGVILAGGLDQPTLGDAWRRYVALAPQYHENHVLSASLAFNLLLGRSLPHSPHDLAEAREVCEELGLADLLRRMPSGLEQMVGETGWQLSQGERSRVFLARALLQNAEVVVLDESLAALDPENLTLCVECIMKRARSALVVAHP